MSNKFTIYSFVGSQWAGTAHLTLAEKGFTEADYEVKEIDIVTAENFDPDYLKINPNGTIPSLTAPSLEKPLIESTDIVRYLDHLRNGPSLVPEQFEAKKAVKALLDLVHSADVDTNIILLQARDKEEMEEKRGSIWREFIGNRQTKLETERIADPDHPFYGPKAEENGQLHSLYVTEIGSKHEAFFKETHGRYRVFAASMVKLESLLVLPYAVGDSITEADFHVVPWLSHAMMGAGTEPSEIQNFGPLETLIQKSVVGFHVGPKTKQWWSNISATTSFKKVFPVLH